MTTITGRAPASGWNKSATDGFKTAKKIADRGLFEFPANL
jgi:hypothetical protein